ncbi:MAG: DUF4177 domain-containing protein [Pseudomonadota bacterium]
MVRYEYKVMPAPEKGKKAKGVRAGDERFAYALEEMMNSLGAEGWEYWRADTLPCEERQGLTGKTTKYMNMLVFRRPFEAQAAADPAIAGLLAAPEPEPAPEVHEPVLAARSDSASGAPPLGPATAPEATPTTAAAAAAAAFNSDRVRRALLGGDDEKRDLAAE